MAPQNHAAWLMKKQDPVFVVDDAPYSKPEADELVINTKALAINPCDYGIQRMGILVNTYPTILGCDVAGIVEEIGSGISDFKIGDRVVGTALVLTGSKYAAFQQYVVLKMPQIAKIPDASSFTDAAVLPLGINTAASCLFHEATLGLEMPPGQGGKDKTLLIWGASSSVGACGVQLATAAGYEVFGIASSKNHDLIKSLGASKTFDQNDPNIVAEVVNALKHKTCVGAYDAISKPETLHALCEILHESGGKKLIAAVMPGAESSTKHDVVIKTNFACVAADGPINQHIWRVFLEPALASGQFQYAPPADVIGHGLENVQKACDLLAEGVSAKKLVVAL